MNHFFDIQVAEKYDVNSAIFLNNLAFWVQRNVVNNHHFHKGKFWTFNSVDAYKLLFPYWTRQNLRTVINNCIKNGLIIKDNFNKSHYDRTAWYAFTDKGLSLFPLLQTQINSICENQQMKKLEPTNQSVGTNTPIPDRNTDRNTDKNICASNDAPSCFPDFWIEYPIKKNRIRCEKIWEKNNLNKDAKEIIGKLKTIKQIEWQDIDQKFIPNPDTYLKERRWEDDIKYPKNSKKEIKSTVGFWNSDLQVKEKNSDREVARKNIKAIKKSLGRK